MFYAIAIFYELVDINVVNVAIKEAKKDQAELLSKIALISKRYWNYPDEWFELWADMLVITPAFIEKNNVWLAINNKLILGFIALSMQKDVAELEHMWVLPKHINKGIGKMLMSHALKFCSEKNISMLRIEADPNAKGFYEKFGAKQVGVVKSKPSPRVLPVLIIEIANIYPALINENKS